MKELCSDFEHKQVINATLSDFFEHANLRQSDCNLWRLIHNGRITSSTFSEIIQRRDDTDPVSIQRRIMRCTLMMVLPTPIKCGREGSHMFAYV